MPIRVYRCREGHETEVSFPGAYPKVHPCKYCIDEEAKNVPARIAISVDVPQQIAALKKRGLIPYERGMEKDAESALASKQAKHEQRLYRIVDEQVRRDQTLRPD